MNASFLHEGVAVQVKNMIRQDADMFEKCVLAAALIDIKRARTYVDIIGTLSDKSQTEDFENQWHWVIYQGIMHYYRYICAAGMPTQTPPLDINALRRSLEEIAKQGESAPLSMVGDLINYMEANLSQLYHSASTTLSIVDTGFVFWLTERRKRVLMQKSEREMWDSAILSETLKREARYLSNVGQTEENMFAFGHGIDNPRPFTPRTRSTIHHLNELLGGGFGKQEATLVIAPNGAGKTVISTQFGSEFALAGSSGLIITTEQGHHLLESRIISSTCRVPFELVKDGINAEILMRFSSTQRDKYEEVRNVLSKRLLIYDWPSGTARSVEAGMYEDLQRAQERLNGRLDFFILDWLGSALGVKARSAEEKRMMISAGADATKNFAKDFNAIGIVMAQATASLSINKPRIDQTCIADCKSASDNMTNIIGISLMYDKEDPTSTKPAKEQLLSVPKSRMGETGSVRVFRDFGYQKFSNLASDAHPVPWR